MTLLHGITSPDGHPNWHFAIEHWYHPQHFGSFRPLMTLWQLSLLQLFGPHPLLFHLASALLFAVYPLQFGTAVYLSAASGQLSALFALGALTAVLRWRREHDWRWLVAGLTFGALALASKESAIMLPFAVVAVAWLDQPRWRAWNAARDAAIAAAPFGGLSGLYTMHRYFVFGSAVPSYNPFDTNTRA